MAVRVDLLVSLDGFATTTDQTPENPFGPDWSRLVAAYVATRTFRERVFKDTSGEGTTGLDDEYAKDYFTNIGAEIMGAGMFGLHAFPDDLDWKGWWGDELAGRGHRARCAPPGGQGRPAPHRLHAHP
jgi:hypothetical protein